MTATSAKLIRGATGDWEMVIGLEVHAQVTISQSPVAPFISFELVALMVFHLRAA